MDNLVSCNYRLPETNRVFAGLLMVFVLWIAASPTPAKTIVKP